MFNKWQVIMLGLVLSQGSSLVAMKKSGENKRRNPLGCSTEVRKEGDLIERIAALKVSTEKSKEENREHFTMYYCYCSGGSPDARKPYRSIEQTGYWYSDCP